MLEFLKKLFSGGPKALRDETSQEVFIYSQCHKCQEKFRNRIDKMHDLLRNYGDEGPAFTVHKEIVGAYCRNVMTVDLEFDEQRRLLGKTIQNGEFLTREEYEGQETESSNE